jgi:Sec-independent protein translocase protein TatA
MTKFLFILLILIVVSGLVALRYRKQIQMALYLLRMFRKMRQMNNSASEEKQIEKTESAPSDVQLVKCARCGKWVPQSKALNLRSKTFYCSANCMENAVAR